jgi:hypothetical protein
MPPFSEKKKKLIAVGGLAGGALSAVVFFAMDILFTDFQKGTWRDAIANDLQTLFSITISPESPAVYLGSLLVLLFLTLVGGAMGAATVLFIEWFFMLLSGEEDGGR